MTYSMSKLYSVWMFNYVILCLQAVSSKCSVVLVSRSLCCVRTTMRMRPTSPSCQCSGGDQTTSCCVTTSNTNSTRTAHPVTASPTARAASIWPSSRSAWRILGFMSALWANATSSLTTASWWLGYQVSATDVMWAGYLLYVRGELTGCVSFYRDCYLGTKEQREEVR